MMKKKNIQIALLITMLAFLISGCTSAGAASSWPGVTIIENTGYVSNGAQTFAVDLKNGSLIWKYPAEAERARQAFSAPKVGEGIAVFGDYNGALIAVDAENGTKQWEFSGAKDRYIGSIVLADGMIYAPNTDHYYYALDTEGSLQWKFKTEGPNWTTPVSDADGIYFASMDHTLYAFEHTFLSASMDIAEDGSKTLRTDVKWTLDLGMAVVADPVLVDGVIFVATIEGKLYAVDAANGSTIWSFNNSGNLGSVWGTPVVGDSIVYFADVDGSVYTVDKETGKQLWPSAFSAGSKIVGGGVLTSDGVIFATEDGKLFLINSEKEPKTISNFEKAIFSPLGISGENIIAAPANEDALLTAIDPNGFEIWSFLPIK